MFTTSQHAGLGLIDKDVSCPSLPSCLLEPSKATVLSVGATTGRDTTNNKQQTTTNSEAQHLGYKLSAEII